MNACAVILAVCLGCAVAQPDPFGIGDLPDYGDILVGGSVVGGNSGETNSFDIFGAAAAAAAGAVGGGGGMGGGMGGGGMGGTGGMHHGMGNGGGVMHHAYAGTGAGYGAGAPRQGYGYGYGNGGMGGGGTRMMGGNPFVDTGANFDSMPYHNNPHLVRNAGGRAQAASASTVAGATIAVIVVVVIFAGIAIFVVRQRRNSRVMIASV